MNKSIFIRQSSFVVALFLFFGLVSCGKSIEREQGTYSGTNQNQSESQGLIENESLTFFQSQIYPSLDKTDILFVFDTSSSLNEERDMVINGLERLLGQLPSSVDIQLGVLLAHATEFSGKLFQNEDGPAVIRGTTEEMKRAFTQRMSQIVQEKVTDEGEAGLLSLYNAIHSPNLEENQKEGFFREDAVLVVIFVSDENDICSRYLEDVSFVQDTGGYEIPAYSQFCLDQNQKPLITHEILWNELLRFKKDFPMVLSAIIYTGENPIAQDSQSVENEIGYGFKELVELGNGILVDLQDPLPDINLTQPSPERIKDSLQKIGQLTAEKLLRLQNTFVLPHALVIPETIQVTVDGVETSFTFDAETRRVKVQFTGHAGSNVTITYHYISQT